jgi:hypothetical protein
VEVERLSCFEEEAEAERRSGEGWPERERRISWIMVYRMLGANLSTLEVVGLVGAVSLRHLLFNAGGALLGAAVGEGLDEEDEGAEELEAAAHRAADCRWELENGTG